MVVTPLPTTEEQERVSPQPEGEVVRQISDVAIECGKHSKVVHLLRGPPHDTCTDTFTGMGVDVWYVYNATFDGALTITPTPDDPLVWSTQLSVYEGTCGALEDPPYVCAGTDLAAVVPVSNGVS